MALPPEPRAGYLKAHVGTGAAVIGEALSKILNRILSIKFPAYWDAEMGEEIGILCVGAVTWAAIALTPAGER